MKQTFLNSIKRIKGFFANTFCKDSQHTAQTIEQYIQHINNLSQHTKSELTTLINELKELPKQREDQLRDRIKTLRYHPRQTRKELSAFVKQLSIFPTPTANELSDLVDQTRYLSAQMQEHTDSIVARLRQLPLYTSKQTDTLIEDVGNLKLPTAINDALIAHIKGIVLTEQQKMIANISHLEHRSQEQLIILTDLIKKHTPNCAMIVLFGSYARGRAVIYDEYFVNGVRNTYQSDFDILVVIPYTNTTDIEEQLNEKLIAEYDALFADEIHTPPQFIVESDSTLISKLKRKQPFFSDIISDGILLFDNGKVILPEPKEFTFAEKKEFAEEGFEAYIHFSDRRLFVAKINFDNEWYKECAFDLHQACENYYHAMGMVFDNYTPKLHKLNIFAARTKGYSRDLATVFPRNTEFEKNTFILLCQAYIKARYDKNYTVTKEELEYMMERIEILKTIAHRICHERIAYYDSRIEDK